MRTLSIRFGFWGILMGLSLAVWGQDTTVANLFQVNGEVPEYVEGEVLVKYKATAGARAVAPQLEAAGVETVQEFRQINVLKCRVLPTARAAKSMEQILEELRSDPNIEYAEPNYYWHIYQSTPNDPRYGDQWALHNTGQGGGFVDADIDAPEAWDIQRGSSQVVVGVIDTGIDYNHPDLQANMWKNPGESGNGKETNGVDDDGNGYVDDWRGWDFANNDNDPFDDNAHGTHVAGIIGAVGNNGKGVSGANWTVSLVGLKFLTGSGSGTTDDAIEAILYAVQMGFPILNNSWGGGGFSQGLADAIEAANQAGILFVAAAGNNGRNNDTSPNYPSNYTSENVLAVASSDRRDLRSSFSNYGLVSVDLAAPGSDILSTVPNGGYQEFSGTSMATPYAVGVAALVLAQFPGSGPEVLKYRLMGGVDIVSNFADRTVTEGRLNAVKALSTHPLVTTEKHPGTSETQNPYGITAFIVDDGSIASATLHYELSGTGSGSGDVPMTGNGVEYSASIAAQPLETDVSYYVTAVDDQGNQTQGRTLTFRVSGNVPPPPNGGCCGAAAMTVHTGNLSMDVLATLFLNVLLFLGLPFYLYKRRN